MPIVRDRPLRFLLSKKILGYAVAVVVVPAATAVLKSFANQINPVTVALALLLIVLFVATAWGPKPAILASLLGVASFNFFFLPPLHTFIIDDPENWIALFAFLITAITVGQLSARAKHRAEEANLARQEIERLYLELQDSFEQASQAQALKQSERLKSALLDAVTHDLRTPLTSIKASVTTLIDDGRTAQNNIYRGALGQEGRQEMLEVIDEEADRLDRFIEGLMELARIDAGELQLEKRTVSVSEILSAATKRAQPRTRRHHVQIEPLPELPPVSVDEAALVEVLYVLLDNAAKYSEPGTTIKMSASFAANEVVIAVADEGCGIPRQLRERVFDKFFRVTGGGQSQPAGTGMGLAIAQGIMEAHGGRIFIEDGDNGVGVRVVVALKTESRPLEIRHGSVET